VLLLGRPALIPIDQKEQHWQRADPACSIQRRPVAYQPAYTLVYERAVPSQRPVVYVSRYLTAACLLVSRPDRNVMQHSATAELSELARETRFIPSKFPAARERKIVNRTEKCISRASAAQPIGCRIVLLKLPQNIREITSISNAEMAPCLTLPFLRSRCLLGRHPPRRPQHGPSAHPRQTSTVIYVTSVHFSFCKAVVTCKINKRNSRKTFLLIFCVLHVTIRPNEITSYHSDTEHDTTPTVAYLHCQ